MADELRNQLQGLWTAVTPGWEEHAAYVDARSKDLTAAVLDRADLSPGDRVLELACGPGGLGLAAAARVAPGGEVVLSDFVPEMTAIAAARAAELRLDGVSARVLDIEDIDEPDSSYDVILCREGLMFATDPARAAGEIARVLRPGGRIAVAVWGPRERNPWLGLMLDAVSEQLGAPIPPPGVPGPFALADADRLAALLNDAGLAVEVGDVAVPMRTDSFDEWWTRTAALAGPLSQILANMPAEAVEAIRARARDAAAGYVVDGGLEFPGVSLVASGRSR